MSLCQSVTAEECSVMSLSLLGGGLMRADRLHVSAVKDQGL